MRALICRQWGGIEQLQIGEAPVPRPGRGEVLIRVKATAVNYADAIMVAGRYQTKPELPFSPGLETAGVIESCGPDVQRLKPGDRVMGMCSGAHAELVCVDERLLIRIPASVSFQDAATWPAALMTAHDALVSRGRLERHHCVLVQAATSSIGIAAVQLARVFGARVVLGSTSSLAKQERLRASGVDHALVSGTSFVTQVRDATGGHGADLIIDHIGGPALAENMACAALDARIVSVGRMGGKLAELDLDLLSLKRLSLIGVTFRTRSPDDVAQVIAHMMADVGHLLSQGRFKMPIDRVFPLEQVAQAHAWMRSGQHFGKVVLEP